MASPLIFFISTLVIFSSFQNISGKNASKFPAIFIFGDSLLDTGNNNFIATPAKANHYPYGLSFPGRIPTGRFSDGKLISDFLASALGIKSTVPPFLYPSLSNYDIRTGVVFASAGSGYDDVTTLGSGAIPVSKQTSLFARYVERLKVVVGEEEAANIIKKSLVVVTSGSNDFGISFYGSTIRSSQFSVNGYQDFLQQRIFDFVKVLYGLGCRNMLIAGLPPLGCFPAQLTRKYRFDRTCLEDENSDSQTYNQKLEERLPEFQAALPGTKLVYADIYTPLFDMRNDPQKYGFVVTDRGCCGSGFTEAGPTCSLTTPVCPNPSQYMFWDAVHPSEVAYRYISQYWEENSLPKFA